MSFIYNEYGTMKNKKVQEVSDMIDTLARQLFKQLMEEEYPLSDIRLAAAYLEQAINVTACEEILRKAMKMSKEAGRNSAESIATIMELSIQADQTHFR